MEAPRASSKGKRGGLGEPNVHAAARSGDLHAVESICNSDPLAVNSRDKHSRTPLHLAAWAGQTQVVSYLCKHKADVGASAMDDTSAIHFASQKGHLEVVRILLSYGVSVKVSNRKGLTPLHFAVQGSHRELIRYLVRKGSDLGAKTRGGQTPLDLARSDEIQKLLVECEQQIKSSGGGDKEVTIQENQVVTDATSNLSSEDGRKDKDMSDERGVEETTGESPSRPTKKSRVSLTHLTEESDAEDGEQEIE